MEVKTSQINLCTICNKSYANKSHLKQHLKVHSEDKSTPYICTVCDVSFRTKKMLRAHQNVHKEKSFQCRICTKQFRTLVELERHHVSLHPDMQLVLPDNTVKTVKMITCELCQKPFYLKGHLEMHMQSHTGEKPYKCETCGKGFSQLVNLKTHRSVHAGIKAFECHICTREFTFAANMKRHLMTHRGNKFKCKYCDTAFNSPGDLKCHMKIPGTNKNYCCDLCCETFACNSAWKAHQKIHRREASIETVRKESLETDHGIRDNCGATTPTITTCESILHFENGTEIQEKAPLTEDPERSKLKQNDMVNNNVKQKGSGSRLFVNFSLTNLSKLNLRLSSIK